VIIVPHQGGHGKGRALQPPKNAEIRTEAAHKPRYQREVLIGVFQSDEIRATLGDRLERSGVDRQRTTLPRLTDMAIARPSTAVRLIEPSAASRQFIASRRAATIRAAQTCAALS
jgi:hypothetical protein